jgi:hypothetical protein
VMRPGQLMASCSWHRTTEGVALKSPVTHPIAGLRPEEC